MMARKSALQLLLASATAALLAATAPAAATPPHNTPLTPATATEMPQRWTYVAPYDPADSVNASWWLEFNDPVLDSLVTAGRDNNYDILAALRRMDAARAQVGMAKSSYFPQVNLSAGWTKERTSGMTTPRDMGATTVDFFNIGASASWQIDVFGKITAGVRERKASWRASKAEADGVLLSITAQIVETYINYRVAQAQLQVALTHSASQDRIVKIADARHETGLASALDPAQARTVYYSTVATIPQLQTQIHTYYNALATLLGEYPENLPAGLAETRPLPTCPAMPAAGIPADLLRRRPDILEAEQNLASAAAALGIAKKDFLPNLSINATIGTQSHSFDNLFKNHSLTYSIAPTLSWTLFSGFNRKFAVAEAKMQMEALIATYNSAVQTAFAETDNAIFAYNRELQVIADLDNAVAQAHKSYTLSLDLYKSGESNFTNVADAMISYLTYTNSYIAAQGSAINALVTLYKALGGDTPNYSAD